MTFADGQNVEAALEASGAERRFYVSLLRDVLFWMRTKGFYWRDFGPRNILYAADRKELVLVDFELPLTLGFQSMAADRYAFYCQDWVILQLAAVLLPREQRLLCPELWNYVRSGAIPISRLEGRRRRRYIDTYFPNRRTICHSDLLWIQKRIAHFLTPFYQHGRLYYPRSALSGIHDARRYIRIVRDLERHPKSHWLAIIEQL